MKNDDIIRRVGELCDVLCEVDSEVDLQTSILKVELLRYVYTGTAVAKPGTGTDEYKPVATSQTISGTLRQCLLSQYVDIFFVLYCLKENLDLHAEESVEEFDNLMDTYIIDPEGELP